MRVKDALLVSPPEIPFTVMGKLPAVAVLRAANVIWLAPAAFGFPKDAVTPLGSPDADRLTLPLKPLRGLTITAPTAVDPRSSPRLAGIKDRMKFGAVMMSPMVVVLLSAPHTPVTLTV